MKDSNLCNISRRGIQNSLAMKSSSEHKSRGMELINKPIAALSYLIPPDTHSISLFV